MFRKILHEHFKLAASNYLRDRCCKTEFKRAIGYLDYLRQRLKKHYKKLAERN